MQFGWDISISDTGKLLLIIALFGALVVATVYYVRKHGKDHPIRAFVYTFMGISEVFLALRVYEVLDNTSDAIQAWAVTILAVITGYYAMQTKTQADASVKMAKAMQQPVIAFDFEPLGGDKNKFELRAKNIGPGPAMNPVYIYDTSRQWLQGPPLGSNEKWEELEQRSLMLPVVALYQSVDGRFFVTRLRFVDNEAKEIGQEPEEINKDEYNNELQNRGQRQAMPVKYRGF